MRGKRQCSLKHLCRGDIVRLRTLPTITDFRVGSVHDGSVWVTCRIGGHHFSGHLPEGAVFLVRSAAEEATA